MAELASMQQIYFILDRLTQLASNIYQRGKLNLTDMHVMSEDFFAGLLNIIYGLNLRNANIDKQNAEGIDLYDDKEKVIIQVSATCSKKKIQHSLDEAGKSYKGYHFRFLPMIVCSANSQKKQEYVLSDDITFDPKKDILEIATLLKDVQSDTTGYRVEQVVDYIKKNLCTLSGERLMSGLEYVIVELSKDGSEDSAIDTNLYRIEAKIAFNGLSYGQDIINEYANQYKKVSRIYEEYSKQGQYKSKAVLQKLHNVYLQYKNEYSGDDLFKRIEKELCSLVDAGNMPHGFTQEELEMCVDILMVHAFMECNIFEKPE